MKLPLINSTLNSTQENESLEDTWKTVYLTLKAGEGGSPFPAVLQVS